MGDVLTWLLIFVALFVLMVLAVLYTVHRTLVRRNQVVKGVRSPAPVSWLTSSRKEARLHRRLRAAGQRLELVPATEGLTDVMRGLRVELVELDAHLVTVSRRPSPTRRADRGELVVRVQAIEDLVRRIEERSRGTGVSLEELAERLDVLEAADDELRGLEPG